METTSQNLSAAGGGEGQVRNVFVARQPIFDRSQTLFAYELLFRSGQANVFPNIDGSIATTKIIVNAYAFFGLQAMTGGKPAFINFTRSLILNDIPLLLPQPLTGIEILESVEPDPEVIAACERLKKKGYLLVLDDFVFAEKYRPLLALADIIKIDFVATPPAERAAVFTKVNNKTVRFLAEKVESLEEYQTALKMGYEYFQGYFFSRPEVLSGRDIPTHKVTHLQILHEIHLPGVEFSHLEEIIKRDVSLTFKLLRLINSAAFGLRSEIRSVRQALVLLGLRETKKWLSLIEITCLAEDKPAEIVVQSIVRAKFCELLAPYSGFPESASDLFLMGIFSMIDALCDQPIGILLRELPLSDNIKAALLGESNAYRDVFELVTAYERGDWEKQGAAARRLKTDESALPALYQKSLAWADDFPIK